MSMAVLSCPRVEIKDFVEIVLMWHCSGDIPMNRCDTARFIECVEFSDFLDSIDMWALRMGLRTPTRSDVVKTLHLLYNQEQKQKQ